MPTPSPVGIRVPHGGSCCAKCRYVTHDGQHCASDLYILSIYRGKRMGDNHFVDGKTGRAVLDPWDFCCNFYDTPS